MDNKIQELTNKIYREGVEKGTEEAQLIIKTAEEEARKIIETAEKEAEAIIESSRKTAGELSANTKSELALYASQAVSALKTEITNVLTRCVVEESVKAFTANKEYLNEFIVSLAAKWSVDEPIVIEVSDVESLKSYFAREAKELLDKGVEIRKINGAHTHFTISPQNGSYKVNFGEEEFTSYFKEFLRPQLVKMLFNDCT